MSKPDKPIFNQQGGRGKLYGPTHGATYMGTYQMPDGKMDRRMFNCATNKDAIRAYTDWCADMDARILEEMEEKVRPKAKAQQPKEKPAYTEPFKKDEVKGADMATTADAKLDKIYVVMVVGGVAVAWCESFDKAVAVCDALTLGAKASGFAATYDVRAIVDAEDENNLAYRVAMATKIHCTIVGVKRVSTKTGYDKYEITYRTFGKDEDETIPSPLIGDFRYGKVTEWLWAKKNDDGTDYWPGRRAVLYKHNDPPKEGDMSSAGYRCCVFAEALDK